MSTWKLEKRAVDPLKEDCVSIHIELGNAAMCTPRDAASVLLELSEILHGAPLDPDYEVAVSIRDSNGNTCGLLRARFPQPHDEEK